MYYNSKFIRFYTVLGALLLGSCVTLKNQYLDGSFWENSEQAGKSIIVIFDKVNLLKGNWFSCTPAKPTVKIENAYAKVSYSNATGYCFGVWFDPIDVTKTPLLKVRLKYRSKTKVKKTNILVGFTDINKNKLYIPSKVAEVEHGKETEELVFDYGYEMNNNGVNFNYTQVNSVLFYINLSTEKFHTGDLIIEGIALSERL